MENFRGVSKEESGNVTHLCACSPFSGASTLVKYLLNDLFVAKDAHFVDKAARNKVVGDGMLVGILS
jgi:hypothetical protein